MGGLTSLPFNPIQVALAFQKGSPYVGIFDRILTR